MNARKGIVYAIAATCAVAALCVAVALLDRKTALVSNNSRPIAVLEVPDFNRSAEDIETDFFIEDKRASSAWSSASAMVEPLEERVVAGVVNHHTLALDLIASFFAQLQASGQTVRRIIVICPDHFKAGRDEISTHSRSYRVGSKELSIDTEAVRRLVSEGVAMEENGEMFVREHGIGALAPFIARAYPDVRIVPIAFRGDLSKARMKRLSDALKELWDDETMVVISADMSHYLGREEALRNDEVTDRLLQEKDPAIALSTDAFIDSGKSVSILFSTMNERYPRAEFIRFKHAISSDYGGDPSFTTSYITGVWREKR